MQKLKFRIEYVKGNKFHKLADNVTLTFPDNVGTFPVPTDKNCYKALLEQHPRIYDRVPMCGEHYKCGLYFDVVRKKRKRKKY